MRVETDTDHVCPVCGSNWKFGMVFPPEGPDSAWFVPEDTGWCANPTCPMTREQRDEYRKVRRDRGWDPSSPQR